MKRLIIFAGLLLLGGCVAGKKTGPSAPAEPLPANTPMVAKMQEEHQKTLRLALKTNPEAALTVPIASVPPIQDGFSAPWQNMTTLTIIASGCHVGAEQCISPSLPAAATGQRAEDEGVAGREAGDEAATGAGTGDSGGVVSKPEESAAAAPPPADVRLLAPAK